MKLSLMKIVLLLLVAICGYYGYKYYRYASDPLVAGVPPRKNADGTYDYTMFSKEGREGEFPGKIREWVVRLDPKYVGRAYGEEDFSINGGGFEVSSKGRHNLGYNIYLKVSDLRPVANIEKVRDFLPDELPSFEVILDAEKDYKVDEERQGLYDTQYYCAPLNQQEFGLELFGPSKEKNLSCRDGTLYALWQDKKKKKLAATLLCRTKSTSCNAVVYLSGRKLLGYYGFNARDKFSDFIPRFEKFMIEHTVVDHQYSGTPFVYGENK